jgi:preprotein translocase subunit SecE
MASEWSKAEGEGAGPLARAASWVRSLLTVYKPGQGVRARLVLLATAGIMAYFCGQWLREEMIEMRALWSYGVPFAVGGLLVLAGLFFANWPRLVDLLIETESELNKVSWSSRKDLWKSTWVVIFTIVLMATFMFAVVRIVSVIFYQANVLKRGERRAEVTAPWAGGERLAARSSAAAGDDGPAGTV